MKRIALFSLATVAFVVACGGSSEAALPPDSINNNVDAAPELHVYNWEDFFPDELFEIFEEETGIQVRRSYYTEEEEMGAVVIAEPGVYDIVVPSLSYAEIMFDRRQIRQLDHDSLPNLEHLEPRFAKLFEESSSCAPFDWGTTGIAYNKAFIGDEISSWADLWNPAYAGHSSMINNAEEAIGAALKYLGYSINTNDSDELFEAEALLLENKDVLVGFAGSDLYWDSLESGDGVIWIAQAWSGDAIAIGAENPDIEFVVPKEGTDVFVECLAITRDAPNVDEALTFINFVLRPDVNALLNNYTGYASTNQTAIENGLIDEELANNPALYPDPELLEAWSTDVSVERNRLINKIWAEVSN